MKEHVQRIPSKRAEACAGFIYRPSKRVMQQRPSQPKSDGFTYRPRPRPKRKPRRQISRTVLAMAAMEEYRLGGDSICALYASMLVRALYAADPEMEQLLGKPKVSERN